MVQKQSSREITLDIGFSPGDVVVLTGAVRDLKKAHPEYSINVRGSCMEIFEHNPHLQSPLGPREFQAIGNADNLTRLGYEIRPDMHSLFREVAASRKMLAVTEGDTVRYYHTDVGQSSEGLLFEAPGPEMPIGEQEFVQVEYPDIHNCGWSGRHFSTAYHLYLEDKLGVDIPQTSLYPELYLSREEKGWMNQVEQTFGYPGPYWLINAGHKSDYPLKQWGLDNWQQLVDLLRDRVQFVQIGELTPDSVLEEYEAGKCDRLAHIHPKLDGVYDLRGKTNLRELIRLCYHAQGAVCGVTVLMHMMAAFRKPCVTVAGGREPRRWEQYPMHRYVDTLGWLPCCDDNGCWLSGRRDDHGENKTCRRMAGRRPLCMQLIKPERVAEEVLGYFRGGVL